MNAKNTLLAIGSLAALTACTDAPVTGVRAPDSAAPVRMAPAGQGVEGSYIVVLKEGADARGVASAVGARPRHVYGAALDGFAGELTRGQLVALRHNPRVDYIQQEQTGTIATTQTSAPWNLDRIDQRPGVWPFSARTYTYTSTGAAVTAYVIDSGIFALNPQFGGRANPVFGFTAYPDGLGDCNGHGTHVAGTIGAATYGVAKAVKLISVRVTNCNGIYWSGDLVAGIDWVIRNHVRPAVANLSLGGGYDPAVNEAVTRLINAGVFASVAAGNSGQNACSYSPSSVVAATVVGATDNFDQRASFSNHGSCVDLYAPGVSIQSTSPVPGITVTMQGTSMAAPHVAGVAALYKATYGDAPQATIEAWLRNNATVNVISGNPAGTPNLLLFKGGL